MPSAILRFLNPTYTPPTESPWQQVSVPKSSAKPQTGPILVDAETQTFDFQHGAQRKTTVGVVKTLTQYDAGLLAERNQNLGLAARLKPFYFEGMSAAQMAKAGGVSVDAAKKIRGTFGAALKNEQSETK